MNEEKRPGSFLAVIPARGGSKGLPGKNRMSIQGMGLTARAVAVARRVEAIRWILVSTDDDAIARQAEQAGAMVPFRRPADLSRSGTPMVEVLEHAYAWFRSSMERESRLCEGMVLLQPTSPMRTSAHVAGALACFSEARRGDGSVAAVHTVSRVPHRYLPWKLWQRDEGDGGSAKPAFRSAEGEARQAGALLFYRNAVAVVLDPRRLNALTLGEGKVLPYVMDEEIPTIDTLLDFLFIEHLGGTLEPPTAPFGPDGRCGAP